MREQIIHGLRSRGWSRIDAETEADDRVERLRQKREEPDPDFLRDRQQNAEMQRQQDER